VESVYIILQQFIQETIYQISSKSTEFYRRYYKKQFGLFLFRTQCIAYSTNAEFLRLRNSRISSLLRCCWCDHSSL